MALPFSISYPSHPPILSVEMHTTGEPTRIIYSGYPSLQGTLLQQRTLAKQKHDQVRRRMMLEPRGHFDMYGAVLRPDTELTRSGEADMGVLFMTNEGYSTMCGHATIALGRYLVDTWDAEIFPRRADLKFNESTKTVYLRLHTPCGLVEVIVPTTNDGRKSDSKRPVSFMSVPSFAMAWAVEVTVPVTARWSELGNANSVFVDFAYGGAFYCIVSAKELGFEDGLENIDLKRANDVTACLKKLLKSRTYARYYKHPDQEVLSFLYGIIIVDESLGVQMEGSGRVETGLCFFADQQIDRSPTGSGVAARVALAYTKGQLQQGETCIYHSLVSNAYGGQGYMIGKALRISAGHEIDSHQWPTVSVQVAGFAYYTGFHSSVFEEDDQIGNDSFIFNQLSGGERKI